MARRGGWRYRQPRCWCGRAAFFNNRDGERVCVFHLEQEDVNAVAGDDGGGGGMDGGGGVDGAVVAAAAARADCVAGGEPGGGAAGAGDWGLATRMLARRRAGEGVVLVGGEPTVKSVEALVWLN